MIKAIFFDVDGTLFSHKSEDVPPGTRRALAKLRAQGIKTVVATGRHRIELEKMPVNELEFDGYLTLNGNLILDENQKMYAGTPIDRGEMEVLAEMFAIKKIPFILIGEDERYINFVDETVIRTQREARAKVPKIGNWKGEDIYQILAFVPEREKQILDEFLDECAITSWNDTGIDIIPRDGGKSAGIRKFMQQYGIDRSEIMAFGDSENDIDMLQFAGIGVAMGNASDNVKAVADYITDSVDENGIENALRYFHLID